jgi:hypothetical protein
MSTRKPGSSGGAYHPMPHDRLVDPITADRDQGKQAQRRNPKLIGPPQQRSWRPIAFWNAFCNRHRI